MLKQLFQLSYLFEKNVKNNQTSGKGEPSPLKTFKQKLTIICYTKISGHAFLCLDLVAIFPTIQRKVFSK